MFEKNRRFSTRKSMFIQGIEAFLFSPFYADLAERVDKVVAENALHGGDGMSVYLRGRLLTNYKNRHKKHASKTQVASHLIPLVQELLDEYDSIDKDQKEIANGVSAILPIDPDYQDIRDSLPDYLKCHELCTYELKRTREEAYFVSKNPQKLKDWHKTRDVIEKYMVTRFLTA